LGAQARREKRANSLSAAQQGVWPVSPAFRVSLGLNAQSPCDSQLELNCLFVCLFRNLHCKVFFFKDKRGAPHNDRALAENN
jgi:hypothetical protein